MSLSRLTIPGLCGVLLLLAACGPVGQDGGSDGSPDDYLTGGGIGGSGDGGDGGPGDGGSASIRLTLLGRHAPGIESLDVTVEQIELHRIPESPLEAGEWVILTSVLQTHDIVRLVDGREAILVDALVEPGTFNQIRFQIRGASVTVAGQTHDMHLVGNGQDLIQPGMAFTVEEGSHSVLRLDFDPVQSVHRGGGTYNINPELSLVDPASQGSISGEVRPLGIGAEVAAYHGRTHGLVAAAVVREDGTYTIERLPASDESGAPILYSLESTAPGYVAEHIHFNVSVEPGGETEGIDFFLEQGSADWDHTVHDHEGWEHEDWQRGDWEHEDSNHDHSHR